MRCCLHIHLRHQRIRVSWLLVIVNNRALLRRAYQLLMLVRLYAQRFVRKLDRDTMLCEISVLRRCWLPLHATASRPCWSGFDDVYIIGWSQKESQRWQVVTPRGATSRPAHPPTAGDKVSQLAAEDRRAAQTGEAARTTASPPCVARARRAAHPTHRAPAARRDSRPHLPGPEQVPAHRRRHANPCGEGVLPRGHVRSFCSGSLRVGV